MKSCSTQVVCSALLWHLQIALSTSSRIPSFIHGINARAGDSRCNSLLISLRKSERKGGNAPSSGVCMNMDAGDGELTSALATLDREWQITNRSSNRPTGGSAGWTKLVLQNDDDVDSEKNANVMQDEKFVYLLEPSTTPSVVILFLGGAGLGQFPHIAYSQLLSEVSQTLNAAVIAAPYAVGLDHFELSKSSGELLRRAVIQCEELGGYSSNLPKFYLSHSLGGKLFSIALAAGGLASDIRGVGFLAYNNFGFKDTIRMVKSISREMRNDDDSVGEGTESSFNDFVGGGGNQSAMFEKALEFAEQAVSMIGLEFSPSPSDTSRMISMKYDKTLQEKTRLFVFDDDDLDSSKDFIRACQEGDTTDSIGDGGKVTLSGLPGKHLTPVYLNFSLNDLPIPEEAQELAGDYAGGFRGASFGDDEKMKITAREICDWIMGKMPSRKPHWEQDQQRQISGIVDSEGE